MPHSAAECSKELSATAAAHALQNCSLPDISERLGLGAQKPLPLKVRLRNLAEIPNLRSRLQQALAVARSSLLLVTVAIARCQQQFLPQESSYLPAVRSYVEEAAQLKEDGGDLIELLGRFEGASPKLTGTQRMTVFFHALKELTSVCKSFSDITAVCKALGIVKVVQLSSQQPIERKFQ